MNIIFSDGLRAGGNYKKVWSRFANSAEHLRLCEKEADNCTPHPILIWNTLLVGTRNYRITKNRRSV